MSEMDKIIEDFEEYLNSCKQSLFSKSIKVDGDVVYEFISELQSAFPKDIKRAEDILENEKRIISEANGEATSIKEEAKEYANKLVSENEITIAAQNRADVILKNAHEESDKLLTDAKNEADETLAKAKAESKEMVTKATNKANDITESGFNYVDEILSQAEKALADTLEQSNIHYYKFENYLREQTNVISNNKAELKMSRQSFDEGEE